MAVQPARSFDEAIAVKPLSSHTYAATLRLEWCIGTVPHGGYITSAFLNVACTHMRLNHPTRHNGCADPMTMHLTFLRRTEAGPATFRVEDTKLGARTSTLHITLSQTDKNGGLREEVAAYITMSNFDTEEGPSMVTGFELTPKPEPGSGGSAPVDLAKLARDGKDGAWSQFAVAFTSMRTASKQLEIYTPKSLERVKRGFVEQWVRFKPYGSLAPWTNPALGFLVDMFPMMLETFDSKPWEKKQEQKKEDGTRRFWYPTVLLNVEFKKRLPKEGVQWLYSRVHTKTLHNGRMDLDIVVLDEAGDIVALSNHVALVVGAERNTSERGSNGNGNGKSIKL
ncbi:conserved hypothetical protein [Uncinocarpus reesii 1704]|uniref:Thioesterase-like superfamily-domain-containing protein n=1 Tax=Uncinocarpus reesii (strain UAMH 1704) TaxID=336963 RepID=C4K030_UNCRE|nr:uncharacterized protein UREG_07781 [Uncinocarpus reesii 1704]EEP82916.1 conserved hypothetical protein [Uncinocarpus reesii 1704]